MTAGSVEVAVLEEEAGDVAGVAAEVKKGD